MASPHDHFMGLALAEARKGASKGNKLVGAVVVKDDRVVGAGHNTVASENNLVNHAEVVAISDACRNLATLDLSGATLYSTMEPCPMCLWAIHLAGISRLVLGGRHASMGRPDLGDYSVEALLALTRQNMEVVTGVRTDECERLRREWNRLHAAG